MRLRHVRQLSVLFLSVVLVSDARAQASVPTVGLARGIEFPEPFSSVASLHELPDGQLLLVDRVEKRLLRVNVASETATDVARVGQGPLEISGLGQLITAPPDRPLYHDIQQVRLLRFDATGRPTETVSLGSGIEDMQAVGGIFGADALGRLYAVPPPMRLPNVAGGAAMPSVIALDDTQVIVRFLPGVPARDTVLRLRSMMEGSNTEITTSATVVTVRTTVPDGRAQDVFALMPNGGFAMLTGDTYRLRFVDAAGRVTFGPSIPTTPRPITAAMQRAAVDSVRATFARSAAESEKRQAELRSRMPAGVDIPLPRSEFIVDLPERWAPTLPAWGGLSRDGTGHFWVPVPRDLLGALAHYDVLSPSGALVGRVTVPAGERIIARSTAWVYTTRTDADDLVYLKRYPMPTFR
jgi:hypothetical protein